MIIDSHCHLLHCYSDQSTLDGGIRQISSQLLYLVDISTNAGEFLNITARKLPSNLLLSCGLYPELAGSYNPQMKLDFERLLNEKRPQAVGEAGIDYHWDYGTPKEQEILFRSQIETSVDLNLPLIVHSREAFEDTYRILSDYSPENPVIIHCFTYSEKEAEKFLERGFYISFAGNITYPNAGGIRNAALMVPLNRILLETDAPYLSPQPVRGQKNNPLNVIYTYQYLAQLRNVELIELETVITENFKRIYNLD